MAQYKKLRPIGPLARRTNADDSVDIVDSEGNIVVSGTIDGGVSLGAFNALSDTVAAQDVTLTELGVTVGGHTTSIGALDAQLNTPTTGLVAVVGALGDTLTALDTREAGHYTTLQAEIAAIDITNPGAIAGLVDGNVGNNSPAFNSYLAPSESGGSIIAADGVLSSVPRAGDYAVADRIDADPQISMYYWGRGAITLIPDKRLPGIVPGTPGTGTRTGGGGPGSVIRIVRRSPQINKQAFQGVYGGFNIDMSGVTASKSFTCNTSSVFTSNGHGRQNGDIIFFDSDSIGTVLPSPLVNGNDSAIAHSYAVTNSTTNTFKVNAYNAGTKAWDTPVTTTAGSGIWSTNLCGIRIANQKPAENANDSDQDYDDNKEYTAGQFQHMDIVGMPGHGMVCEDNNGRLGIESARAMSNRLDGFHILSQDKVFWGHWGAGSNGKFGLYADTGTGVYAVTGNIWGNPGKRSKDCGAIWFDDVMYWALVANQPNDWMRFDGKGHFNAAGAIVGNMIHPHGENFSSDGVAINVYNDGDQRLQSHISVRGYQGVQFAGNAFSRTEGVKSRFNTPGNYNGAQDGANGTAIQQLYHFDTLNGNSAMAQIIEGYCTAPDVKPWQGPSLAAATTTMFTNGSASVNWPGHPLVVGDTVFFSTTGTLPTGFSPLYPNEYFVTAVVDVNNVQLSATYGGGAITAGSAGTGTTTIWQTSSSPYYITGNAQVAGVYVDSYRGVVNLWSKNGIAPKFLIGVNPNDSWRGNPNYQVEIGDRRLSGGLPKHNRLYGAWENPYALGVPKLTSVANRIALHNGDSVSVGAYAGQWYYDVNSGGSIAGATITLPSAMSASYDLTLILNGAITALSMVATLDTNSLKLPTTLSGYTVLQLQYLSDVDKWNVVSISGAGQGWITLSGTSGALSTDLTTGDNFIVGPLTGNATISNPTGTSPRDGKTYTWRVIQDATGGRTVSLGGKFVKPAGDNFCLAANGITLMRTVYDAVLDKYYTLDFKVESGNTWFTLTGTTGAIATDCSKGKSFFLGAVTGNVTISNPTNATDDTLYTWRVLQDGTGGRTITLDTKFEKASLTYVTTASTATYIGARYSAANDKFCVVQFQSGAS